MLYNIKWLYGYSPYLIRATTLKYSPYKQQYDKIWKYLEKHARKLYNYGETLLRSNTLFKLSHIVTY